MYVLDAARIVNEEQASKAKWGGLFTDAQTTRDLLGVIAGSIIRVPKSVPGTGCDARSNASKQGAQIGAWHEWYCTPVVATCRQTVEALLAPLSTAWQRMATIWQRMATIWQRMDTGRA